MSDVKVAFFGAGSFVFGPTLLSQCISEDRISGLTWSLYDADHNAADLMAAIGSRLADSAQVEAKFTSEKDPDAALAGADFVVCSAAIEMNRRFQIDKEIVARHDPKALITEFGGITGLTSSLRQMTMVGYLAKRMKRQCPNAWLLDVSNPLPRVCQAAHEEGVSTVGFCCVSVSGFGRLLEIFQDKASTYPYREAQEIFDIRMGGTNHLSWLIEIRDKASGADLMPSLRARLEERKTSKQSKCEEYGRRTGYFLMSGDSHVQDFLPIDGLETSLDSTSHGADHQRLARRSLLSAIAAGRAEVQLLNPQPSWERPSDFIDAIVNGREANFTSLNLANAGQLTNLPRDAFVETSASIRNRVLTTDTISLPESVLPYSNLVVLINQTFAKAFRCKSRSDLFDIVDLDPTISDKTSARAALYECLSAHKDVIGIYD